MLKNIHLPLFFAGFMLLFPARVFALSQDSILMYNDRMALRLAGDLPQAKEKKIERYILKSYRLTGIPGDLNLLKMLVNRLKAKLSETESPQLVLPVELRMDKAITFPDSFSLDSSLSEMGGPKGFEKQNIHGIMDCEMIFTGKKAVFAMTIIDSKNFNTVFQRIYEENLGFEVTDATTSYHLGLAYNTLSVTVPKTGNYPDSVSFYGLEFGLQQRFLKSRSLFFSFSAQAMILSGGIALEGSKNMVIASPAGGGVQGVELGSGIIFLLGQNKQYPNKGYLKLSAGYNRFIGLEYNDFGYFSLKVISDISKVFSVEAALRLLPELTAPFIPSGEVKSSGSMLGFKIGISLN